MTEAPIIPPAVPDLRGNEAAYLACRVAQAWREAANDPDLMRKQATEIDPPIGVPSLRVSSC